MAPLGLGEREGVKRLASRAFDGLVLRFSGLLLPRADRDLHHPAVGVQSPRVEAENRLPVVGQRVDRILGVVVPPDDLAIVMDVSRCSDSIRQRGEVRIWLS